ncbi:MAG: glycosyl transferase family 1 [Bacteroidia bacterium]|nr:MAG: glycosyl transferase family 1 [Bacteroidia bacterium]
MQTSVFFNSFKPIGMQKNSSLNFSIFRSCHKYFFSFFETMQVFAFLKVPQNFSFFFDEMKILQIANKVPFPPRDGGSIATFTLSKGFADGGHQVSILAMNTSKHFVDLSKNTSETEKIKIQGIFTDTSIKYKDIIKNFFFSKIPYNASRFVQKEFEKALVKTLKEEQFDIVQLEGLYLMPYIATIRKHSNALVALRAHNVEHEIWQRTARQIKNGLKRIYVKNLAKRIKHFEISYLNKYDVLIPITERDGKKLNQLGNKQPSHVCPTGIDVEKVPCSQEQDYPVLFHIGALDWPPNQEGLLWFLYNCWEEISLKYPELKFYIAGRNAPKWFVGKLKLKNVEYCGEVEDASKFICNKSIMIVPLLSGSGMRIKIIEGMAHGKAIISTSIGAEGINYTNQENIMIANTPEYYLRAIEKLISDKAFYAKICMNAKKLIQNEFNNKNITLSLINFYEKQLKQKNNLK